MNIIEKITQLASEEGLTTDEIMDELGYEYTDDEVADLILELLPEVAMAQHYGEPGYPSPDRCVLFDDWNKVDREVQAVLEELGFALEWSDEWLVCDEGKAWRTSPDSFFWRPSCMITRGGEILTTDCPAHEWVDECAVTDPRQPVEQVPASVDVEGEGFSLFPCSENDVFMGHEHVFKEYENAEVVLQYPDKVWIRLEEGLRKAVDEAPEFLTYGQAHERYLNPALNLPWRWDGVCYVKTGYSPCGGQRTFSYNPVTEIGYESEETTAELFRRVLECNSHRSKLSLSRRGMCDILNEMGVSGEHPARQEISDFTGPHSGYFLIHLINGCDEEVWYRIYSDWDNREKILEKHNSEWDEYGNRKEN